MTKVKGLQKTEPAAASLIFMKGFIEMSRTNSRKSGDGHRNNYDGNVMCYIILCTLFVSSSCGRHRQQLLRPGTGCLPRGERGPHHGVAWCGPSPPSSGQPHSVQPHASVHQPAVSARDALLVLGRLRNGGCRRGRVQYCQTRSVCCVIWIGFSERDSKELGVRFHLRTASLF